LSIEIVVRFAICDCRLSIGIVVRFVICDCGEVCDLLFGDETRFARGKINNLLPLWKKEGGLIPKIMVHHCKESGLMPKVMVHESEFEYICASFFKGCK
jgi:hypothetical protein